jgi:DNA-binding SARP family transcriptional activator
MLMVKLFGSGQATYFDRPVPGFPNQRASLLLCYLMLNKHAPFPRERLAAVFWEDYPSHTARKYCRNALWRLRTQLQSAGAVPDDYLLVSDESLAFISMSPHWLDVDEFEASIARTQTLNGSELTPDQAAGLENTVDLYAGDLLETVYEDWCLYDRERLRLLYLAQLNKLMTYHAANQAYDLSLQFGERILSQDNTRENIHRQMIWLYWQMGDRPSALAQYKRCAQILQEELNLQPMEATRQLYQRVLHEPPPQVQWPEPPTRPIPARIPPAEPEAADLPLDPKVLQPMAIQALQKLQRLQQMVEETNHELQQIERMLQRAMSETQSNL